MTKVCDGCNANNDSFALELVREYAKQAKKWFVIAIVELGLIAAVVAGFLYFMSTNDITSTELSTDGGGNANFISGTAGDINNGTN